MVRWSLQHGFVPLPKSTNQGRIEANGAISGFQIDKQDMEKMNGLDEGLVTVSPMAPITLPLILQSRSLIPAEV